MKTIHAMKWYITSLIISLVIYFLFRSTTITNQALPLFCESSIPFAFIPLVLVRSLKLSYQQH